MSHGLPIFGTEEDDVLQGTSDAEDIYGLGGDDVIDGGGGGDELYGGAGNDVYNVGEYDTVVELAGEGDDEVRTTLAAYALAEYVERLTGLSEDGQELIGNGLDNIILGAGGGDVLRGGLGNDSLTGGDGSDIYLFWRGDGDDRISVAPATGRDSLQLLDIFVSNVTVSQSGYDLILTIDEGGGSITLLGSGSSFTSLAEIIFGDTTWSNEDLLAYSTATTGEGPDTLTGDDNDNVIAGLGGDDVLDGAGGDDSLDGGDGDDILRGGTGDDVLEGGAGQDFLAGGEGDDVYRFQPGFGQDVIADSDSSGGGGYDRIDLLDILPDQVTVTAEGDTDLVISINGTDDSIRLENVLVDPQAVIELLAFADGTIWGGEYLVHLASPPHFHGTEVDDVVVGGNLMDTLYGGGGDDSLSGGKGRDYLAGGLGDDFLSGGEGGDGYAYSAGDGNDVILEHDGPGDGGYDDLDIYGYTRWDTTVGRSSDGLSYILYFGGGEESITLYGAASGDPNNRIEYISFEFGSLRGATLGLFARDVGNGDDLLTVTAETYNSLTGMRGLGGNDVITGGGNWDWLRGDAGDDSLIGGEGDDNLEGGVGDDALNGGDGDDRLEGGAGADLLAGGTGNDTYHVDDSGDSIVEAADEGDDYVYSTVAAYALSENVERLTGLSATGQVLIGNALDNFIGASGGDDILEGGAGNDALAGSAGVDVYRFARGDGDDVVTEYWDWATPNAIEFTTDILPEDVSVAQSGSDIVLTVDDDGGSITWRYGGDAPDSFEVRFADGTVWSYAEIIALTLAGGSGADVLAGNYEGNHLRGMGGDDVLTGNYGDDIVEGGAGSDLLSGGSGDDLYRFERGFGQDEIAEADSSGGYGYDRIEFMGDILPGEVSVYSTDEGRSLLLVLAGTADRIAVGNALSDEALAIEQVVFADGTVWTAADLLAMAVPAPALANEQFGTAGDDSLSGGASDDILRGGEGEDVLDGGEGSDWLQGGIGADFLSGGGGGDYYLYDSGDGHDVIQESAGPGDGGHDTIRIGSGLQRGDLTVGRSADGLSYILFFGGGEESITLAGAATAASEYQIEYIRFANGEGMSGAGLAALALDVGNGDDIVAISGETTVLRGLAGDDVLSGASGSDRLRGDSGDDMLSGGDGDDELAGGAGSDLLIGGAGDDVYLGVDDPLDSVIEADGEGQDEIRTSVAVFTLPDHVERLTGQSAEAQALTGNALNNIIYGGSGDDILRGGLGNDVLAGGSGSNIYHFSRGDGDDYIIADYPWGLDRDSLQFGPDILPGQVTVTQGTGFDIVITLDQGGGSVTLRCDFFLVTGVSQLIFGDGTIWSREELVAKSMIGTESGEWLVGDPSDNVLMGLGGSDVLSAGGGNDVLDGGDGNDILLGGWATDQLTGGAGADRFQFIDGETGPGSAADRITDFVPGEDRIAISSYIHGAFTFVGSAVFSGAAGEFRYAFDGTDTWLEGDYDGDGMADLMVVLTGNLTLSASDFLL